MKKDWGIGFCVHKHNSLSYFACSLVMCVSLFLTACNNSSTTKSNNITEKREWVYVPETIVIEDERADYGNMQQVGDTFCYITIGSEDEESMQNICQYSVIDKELITNPIDCQVEGDIVETGAYVFGQDSVWLTANAYSADFSQLRRFLCKLDLEGKNIFSQEITEQLGRDDSISGLFTDEQERIYITSDTGIWLYANDGSFYGFLPYGSSESVQVKGAVTGADNRLFVCIGKGENPDNCTLLEVDFEGKQLIEVIKDFPNIKGFCAGTKPAEASGGQYDFLLYDDIAVYGYDFSAQKKEELFVWLDSDINGYFVESFGESGDGRYYAMVDDGGNDDRRIVLLSRTRAEDAQQRESLVLAAVDGGSELGALAAGFNRSNSQYQLTVENYDSLTDLYNAILANEAIDIIDLSGVNVEKLSRQGALEDLTSYLASSSVFDRSDFLDGILDVYTFDGILAGIPETFTLQTVVGDRAQLENDAGLSLDGLLAAAGRNPNALPFDGLTKEEMMQYIMMFNENAFIDWDTGACHFDSAAFKEILGFVNRFPDSVENEEVSLPNKIHNGEILFAVADIYELKALQLYEGIFGDNAACIGFPTADGKGGTLLFTGNAFGIAAVSENKSGAWEFVESVLNRENEDGGIQRCFPALKKSMNARIDAEMESDSQISDGHFPEYVYEDGWSFPCHAVTQDEINAIMDLIKEAKPFFNVEDDEIIKIINEEASGYYSGQRGLEEVVGVIQNRIQLYVGENM